MRGKITRSIRMLAILAGSFVAAGSAHASFTNIGKMAAGEANQEQILEHQYGGNWHKVGDEYSDVAVGEHEIFAIGHHDNGPGGKHIRVHRAGAWHDLEGAAVRIAVSQNNIPWVVNALGEVFEGNGSGGWHRRGAGTSHAHDIGANHHNNKVWITDKDGHILEYHHIGDKFEAIDGVAVEIDVDRHGNPWVVNAGGDIFRRHDGAWHKVEGHAHDIACGSHGHIFHIGDSDHIYQFHEGGWHKHTGLAKRISAGDSVVAVINASGEVYRSEY